MNDMEEIERIHNETKPLVERISHDGYILNDHDNRELRMRIDALKSTFYNIL